MLYVVYYIIYNTVHNTKVNKRHDLNVDNLKFPY